MKKWIWCGIIMFISASALFSQDRDSLPTERLRQAIDSIEQAPVVVEDEEPAGPRLPNPKKAAYWSLAFPGAGQIYNRSWWKVPIVYGAIGGMVYLIDFNTRQYNRLRTALDLKRQDLPHEFSGTNIDSESALLALRDDFDKDRQLSYIFTVVIYGLQAMEAFVDAHLQNFDVDEDLSFRLKPSFELDPSVGQPTLGFGIVVPLNKQKDKPLVLHPDFEISPQPIEMTGQ
jgi:hypothetical protein